MTAGAWNETGRSAGSPPRRFAAKLPALTDRAVLDDLRRRLRERLGFRLVAADPIVPGYPNNNNRLLRLRAEDGRQAVAKLYVGDHRRRLEREFGLLSLLRDRGVRRVPAPYLRCDEHRYAVYSFEPGVLKRAADLTIAELAEVAAFAADLHRIAPWAVRAARPEAETGLPVADRLSLADLVAEIRRRLARFLPFAASDGAPPAVRALRAELDVAATFASLIAAATAGLTAAELAAHPRPDQLRPTSGDFAPHNLLVRPDGTVCVVDFENGAWDHPLGPIADFLTHDQSLDLGPERAGALLGAFRSAADLDDAGLADLERRCRLLQVEWCAVHLSGTEPGYVARKRFATPDLDADQLVAEQVAKFRRRLALTAAAVGS
jgi:hypothetical protein